MRPWNWLYLTGNSVGSDTTVANRDIKQQSVGMAVKHHASTDTSPTSRQPQDQISSKNINKKSVLSYVECSKLFVKYFGKGVPVL